MVPVSLTGGVFECDLAHRRSVAVLCMLYKIRHNPEMHNLDGVLPVPHVSVRVTSGAAMKHRYTYARPCCRTKQYWRTFIFPVSISVEQSWWPRVRWCVTGRFQERGQYLFIGLAAHSRLSSLVFPLSSFILYGLVMWGWGLRTDRMLNDLWQQCPAKPF